MGPQHINNDVKNNNKSSTASHELEDVFGQQQDVAVNDIGTSHYTPNQILNLQRVVGNRAVQRIIQTKPKPTTPVTSIGPISISPAKPKIRRVLHYSEGATDTGDASFLANLSDEQRKQPHTHLVIGDGTEKLESSGFGSCVGIKFVQAQKFAAIAHFWAAEGKKDQEQADAAVQELSAVLSQINNTAGNPIPQLVQVTLHKGTNPIKGITDVRLAALQNALSSAGYRITGGTTQGATLSYSPQDKARRGSI